MEERSQIVEKRVKSTVIRRRKSEAPPLLVSTSPEDEAPISETQDSPMLIQKSEEIKPQKVEVKKEETKKDEIKKIEELLEEPKDDKDVKLKPKKLKDRGGALDIDIEGAGRITSLPQLNRITHADRVERVFQPSKLGRRKKIVSRKGQKQTLITESKAIKRVIEMTGSIMVGDLAQAMDLKSGLLIKKLMQMGHMATLNQALDFETASLLAQEFKFEMKDVRFDEEKIFRDLEQKVDQTEVTRPPVVTVMGHVDHGKTSLLDAIRESNVTAGEAGGITQHIGAYTVNLPKGKITFLDTPGHAAFSSMRARGASVTDLVVLVVAADDGVMPQTIESIDHAKAAKVPIVVAVNKIDKPSADVERIKRQLADYNLMPEDWGGNTLYTLVSAKEKKGIQELLEAILLQAEVLELRANPRLPAQGVVVESRLDRSRGPMATVLVQQGTLREGDLILAGGASGKVKMMTDHLGNGTREAYPSYAVEVLGLDDVPQASDPFHVVPDEKTAREIISHRKELQKKEAMVGETKISLEDFFAKSKGEGAKELRVIVKADVHGSLEAVTESLTKMPSEKVKIKVIHGAVGGVNESDVLLASASNAIIIGFNVRPETKAIGVAKQEGVDVRLYKIIYEMVDNVKLAMEGLLAPTRKETYVGRAEIRQIFTAAKVGMVAGCEVVDGKMVRGSHLRLLRNNVVLHEGKVSTLKRFKDDAKEVMQGFECGLSIDGYKDIKAGDVIECFDLALIKTEL